MEKLTYKNKKGILIELNPTTKEIFIKDTQDFYNEASGYNQKKRNFKKAYDAIAQMKTVEKEDETKFYQFIELFNNYNLKMNTYCAVD